MNVELELLNHPKYRRLRKRCGAEALEYLVRLWGHCASNKRGEHWPHADADYVEAVAGYDGEPGELFKLLVETRFIDQMPQGVIIHDWNDQNSFTVQNWNRNPHGRRGKTVGYPTVNPRMHTPEPVDNPRGTHGEPLRVSDKSEESEESDTAPTPSVPEAAIPTEAEFLGAFMADSIPEDWLRGKFTWFEGNNKWLDERGQLKRWRILVRGWWRDDRANYRPGSPGGSEKKSRPNGAAPESVWTVQQRIAERERVLERHPANISGMAPSPMPTDEEKADYKKLRAELKAMKEGIAA